MSVKKTVKKRPAETISGGTGLVVASALGLAADEPLTAVIVLAVSLVPAVVTQIKEHGIKGSLRRIWVGRRG